MSGLRVNRRVAFCLFAVAAISVATTALVRGTAIRSAAQSDSRDAATVTAVMTGDLVVVRFDDGAEATVRYLGITAPLPEQVHAQATFVQCFGPEALQHNRELVEGQRVALERDTSDQDTAGNLLRYVRLADGSMVNATLVAGGFAKATPTPPDTRYAAMFEDLETQARITRQGMYGSWCLPI